MKISSKVSAAPNASRDFHDAINRHRRRLVEIAAEHGKIADAHCSKDEAFLRIDDYVDSLVSRANADSLLHKFTYPALANPELGDKFRNDPLQLAAWLDPESIRTKLRDEVERLYKSDSFALTVNDRQRQEAALDAERRKIEIAEERLIIAAEQAGIVISRRPDADPEALLAVLEDE
ncbi:hypothetical protein RM530_05635 [Algiphilus sp. W345]|uniref:Uncharacterized protein n=1 Tax=Banduia mediterranea TaxID=3075609 RepID=A0ABU2WGT3_9GAMM|nr:hypothetical protein [Algiphilus sp. W345]MDT0496844.1 hypothetical protein [Algiphilus sp. W345]